MEIRLSRNAEAKLQLPWEGGASLTAEAVCRALLETESIEEGPGPLRTAIRTLDGRRRLRVLFRDEGGALTVVTFYPSRRGT
jgi:hypothetical protein